MIMIIIIIMMILMVVIRRYKNTNQEGDFWHRLECLGEPGGRFMGAVRSQTNEAAAYKGFLGLF